MACCKSIMHDDVHVGDTIIAGLEHATVTAIRRYLPADRPVGVQIPIHAHLIAVEYVTPRGSRWRGEVVTPTHIVQTPKEN
ncbi:hypothetical protein [Mycolicibacterium fortuitum]|uniref:hypothetical protein n=1 Tax=Mycolicibacterium fortuitum TaxID=1766 RepID=UPI002607090B|nr:hypothetical protein [Mycolicibacterium fortuitum]